MTTVQIQLRRDTAADWTSAAPTLASGEVGVETDTGKFKIGDGATAWASLAYYGAPLYQPLDSDLTAIAALTTTSYGRGLLADADAAAFTTRLTGLLDGTYAALADPLGFGFPVTTDPRVITSSNHLGGTSISYYSRWTGTFSINAIKLHVGTSSGNIAVATYSGSGSGSSKVPASRLATSGSVACPAAGAASVSLGATVSTEGGYASIGADNTTWTMGMAAAAIISSTITAGLNLNQAVFPPPATAAPTVTALRNPVLIGVVA